jgi:drug/metabolite transporter (DMT)-like permease
MNKTKGILSVVLAAFIYGFTPILAKLTYLEGSNTLSLTFYRSFFSLPLLIVILKHNKIPLRITKYELGKLSILGILGPALTAITLYGAYNYISVGMASTIHYVYPVLVTLTCILIFKEKVSKEKIIALIFSTIGVLMFFEGYFTGSVIGIIIALLSGVVYGAFILFMDKSKINVMYPFKITFYTCLIASIFLFIYGIITNQLVFKMTSLGWTYTCLIAFFVSVFANTLMPIAVKNVGATATSILGMFEPITSVILGIMFLAEPFTLKNVIGCSLILIGVLIITIAKDKNDIIEENESIK